MKLFARPARCLLALLAGLVSMAAPAAPKPAVVYTLDLMPLRSRDLSDPRQAREVWDTLHLVSALQGLVNRSEPRLYVFYCAEWGIETDRFWWDWYRRPGGWLEGVAVRRLSDWREALDTLAGPPFDGPVRGFSVYDERVPATSSLASTAAGREGLLPVRWDAAPGSLYQRVMLGLRAEWRVEWLVNRDGSSRFTGASPKNTAYAWARDRWLKGGKTDTHGTLPGGVGAVGAYYLDAWWLKQPAAGGVDMHTLPNHDWFIAQGAFFFDLSPWGDEPPVDEPAQPLGEDKRTLLAILRSLHDRADGGIVKIGGFPPWPYKYTTHGRAGRHEPVPTEWEFTRLISQFNAYKEADAAGLGAMANASFHTHFPLRTRYAQPNRPPGRKDWERRSLVDNDGRVRKALYVGHYVGDYDAPSWLYKSVPAFFRDPARGRVPLGWAFDPNLADRAPQAFVYAYEHATTNDYFIAGDSGAGYLNPRGLTVRPDSGLPSGLEAWRAYCAALYERWGMTITGFMLDGSAGASTDVEFAVYRTFSPDGAGTHFERGPAVHAGLPTCPERDLPDDAKAAADVILQMARAVKERPGFLWARSILKSPSWYAEVSRRVGEAGAPVPVEVVDPYTFFGLVGLEHR